MLYILIALIVAAVLCVMLFRYCDNRYDGLATFGGGMAILAGVVIVILLLAYAVCAMSWFGAEYKARIINREYGTSYTQAEVFYASDVIDTVRELDRKRVEINGDIMRDREGQ